MKIGFYGATGSNDFGDYAMMVHNIQSVLKKHPDYEIYVFTPNKYNTLKNLVDNIINFEMLKSIKIVEEPIITRSFYKKIIDHVCFKFFNKYYYIDKAFNNICKGDYSLLNWEFIETIKKIDIMVFNGGGYLQHSWGKYNIFFAISYTVAAKFNKPVYFLGNSIGPMQNWEHYIKDTINYVDKIMVRDGTNYTAKLLEEFNYHDFVSGPDDLMFVNDIYDNSDIYKLDNYVIIELMCWIEKAQKGAEYVLYAVGKLIEYIISKQHKNVLLITFDNDDWKSKDFINKIYNDSKYKDNIFKYTHINNMYEVFSFYKYCDFSLSFKYHPVILSLGSKKPCMGVICDNDGYYERKFKGAFETAGIDHSNNVIHIDDITPERLIENYNKEHKIITKEKEEQLKSIQEEYMESIIG